jgi:hypothetical protein
MKKIKEIIRSLMPDRIAVLKRITPMGNGRNSFPVVTDEFPPINYKKIKVGETHILSNDGVEHKIVSNGIGEHILLIKEVKSGL